MEFQENGSWNSTEVTDYAQGTVSWDILPEATFFSVIKTQATHNVQYGAYVTKL